MRLKEAALLEKENDIRRMSFEQEIIQDRRESEFKERMIEIFSRNVTDSERHKEDRDSRDVLENYIPLKQEMTFRKEIVAKETVPKKTQVNPVPEQNLKQKIDRATETEIGKAVDGSQTTEIRQTVIDTQCLFPKFSPFSGDEPKPKTEASFIEWKYEVQCIRNEKSYSNTAITQAVRKSLRGQAKRVILPLGPSAKMEDLVERLENVFGNVASGQSILKEFYTATKGETETITAWGLRLEEIFQRAIEKGKAREEDRDSTLREQFWKSLRSERLKNATRVKYENIESFELLRKAVRAEENEIKLTSNIAQHQLKPQTRSEEAKEDRLELVLKRIEALEKGRERGRGNQRKWHYYNENQDNMQNNRPPDRKEEKDQRSETTAVKEPLNR